ncbi:MAG: DUF1232 domain-containing protein [Candidatus Moraniibacteriota bacterium]|nr:MAG: DUF1232 domain-containing protein [Candidatus Moranbacteria bacterium]
MRSFLVAIVGIISFLYLINPTAGIVEFIPDITPVIGNLDEATATALLLSSLGYFGIDIGQLFKREEKKNVKNAKLADKRKK